MVFFVSQVMIYDHDPPSKERLAKIPSPLTVKYNGAFKYVSLFFIKIRDPWGDDWLRYVSSRFRNHQLESWDVFSSYLLSAPCFRQKVVSLTGKFPRNPGQFAVISRGTCRMTAERKGLPRSKKNSDSFENTESLIRFLGVESSSRWWFQIFSIFTPTWGNDPIWLIFFNWVETTN